MKLIWSMLFKFDMMRWFKLTNEKFSYAAKANKELLALRMQQTADATDKSGKLWRELEQAKDDDLDVLLERFGGERI